jgi:hypothetical protein
MTNYFNTSVGNLVYRLRRFDKVLKEELANEILGNEHIILDMIHAQLQQGEDGNGKDIQPPYTSGTVKSKIRRGLPHDRVTLKDTGNFYSSLYLEMDDDGFYVTSDDPKLMNILTKKYGKPILRLSNEHLTQLLNERIRPSLTKKLQAYIQNG